MLLIENLEMIQKHLELVCVKARIESGTIKIYSAESENESYLWKSRNPVIDIASWFQGEWKITPDETPHEIWIFHEKE